MAIGAYVFDSAKPKRGTIYRWLLPAGMIGAPIAVASTTTVYTTSGIAFWILIGIVIIGAIMLGLTLATLDQLSSTP